MERVNQLGYLGIGVSDASAWRRFGCEVLGLEAEPVSDGAPSDAPVRFRMDEYRNRLIIYPGGDDDVAFIGWEVRDRAALTDMTNQLRAAGVAVEAGSAEQAAERRVSALVRFAGPDGVAQEIYCGAELAFEQPFRSPRPISGFVTAEQGLGHVVLGVTNLEASLAFYRDVLGLRESDFIHFGTEQRPIHMAFLHCNPRHHTLALMQAPLPRKLHHLMVQLASLDDVGATYYRCQDRGVPIAGTLGRHTNDHMVSFYMVSPSGFEIEYGWGARTIDDATWQVQTHRAPSIWGHQRPGRPGKPPP